jgi:hypothetical protein
MTLEIVPREEKFKPVPLRELDRRSVFRRQTKKAWFVRIYDPTTLKLRALSLSSGNLVDISEDEFVIPTQVRLVEV